MTFKIVISIALLATVAEASFEQIAGFTPLTQVTDHNAIDLDQQEIEVELEKPEFGAAKAVYTQGAHSKSFAILNLASGLQGEAVKDTPVSGTSVAGSPVVGDLYETAATGSQIVKVQYETSDIQDSYVGCQVGGSADPVTSGCFADNGTIIIDDTEYSYSYDVATANDNGRFIKGFSTSSDKQRPNEDPSEPYFVHFAKFNEYYGNAAYADVIINAAFDRETTNFVRGNVDFRGLSDGAIKQGVKKGTAYLAIAMYVIRELEDAVADCVKGCDVNGLTPDCNDDAVHALDEAVAFYTGSLQGVASDGVLQYALADKRCQNFRTCGEDGGSDEGDSRVNIEIFDEFDRMQNNLKAKDCDAAEVNKDKLVAKMFVPMIQGTLRYAYIKEYENAGTDTEPAEIDQAEGAMFAAAVLPMVNACHEGAAQTIYDNMQIKNADADFRAVKNAFESTYDCLGITCAEVGGYWSDGQYLTDAAPCSDEPVDSGAADSMSWSTPAAIASFILAFMM